jgi:TP901 family phage tail tape measure protein
MANDKLKFVIDVDDQGSPTIRKFGDTVEKSAKNAKASVNKMDAAFSNALKTAAGFAAGAVSIGLLKSAVESTIRAGADFEQQMINVGAVMRLDKDTAQGAASLAALEAAAKKMGETTEHSASTSAEAIRLMGMAGWDTQQSIAALPGLLDLATAGSVALGTAADIVTDQMTAFGMAADQTGRFNDALIGTITRANTDIPKMGESLKYVGPVAKAAGQDIEDTAAQIGILANAGIKGSEAGTALRSILNKTEQAARTLADTTGADLNPKTATLQDVMRAAADAGWGLKEMTEEFGLEASTAAIVLKENVKGLDDLEAALRSNEGEAAKMAGTMRDTTNAAFKEFQSVIEGIKLDIFEEYKDTVKDSTQSATQFFREHKTEIIEFVGNLQMAIEGIITVIGKFASGTAKVVNAAAQISQMAGALSTAHVSMSDFTKRGATLENTLDAIANGTLETRNRILDLKNEIRDLQDRTAHLNFVGADPGEIEKVGQEIGRLTKELEGLQEAAAEKTEMTVDVTATGSSKKPFSEKMAELTVTAEKFKRLTGGSWETVMEMKGTVGGSKKDLSRALDEAQRAYDRMFRDMGSSAAGYYDWELAQIKEQRDEFEAATGDKAMAHEWYIDAVSKLDEDLAKERERQREKEVAAAERAARETESAYSQMYRDLGHEAEGYYDFERAQIEAQARIFEDATGDKLMARKWLDSELEDLDEDRERALRESYREQVRASDDFFQGMLLGFQEITERQRTWAMEGEDLAREFSRGASDALADNLVSLAKGQFDDLGDAWESLWDSMLDKLANTVAEMAVEWAVAEGMSMIGGLVGSFFHEGAWDVSDSSSLKPDEIPAVLQSGEMVIPKAQSEIIRAAAAEYGIDDFDELAKMVAQDAYMGSLLGTGIQLETMGAGGGNAAGGGFSGGGTGESLDAFGMGMLDGAKTGFGKIAAMSVANAVTGQELSIGATLSAGLPSLGLSAVTSGLSSVMGISGKYGKIGSTIFGGLMGMAMGPAGSMMGSFAGGYIGTALADMLDMREKEEMLDAIEQGFVDAASAKYGGFIGNILGHIQGYAHKSTLSSTAATASAAGFDSQGLSGFGSGGYGGYGSLGGIGPSGTAGGGASAGFGGASNPGSMGGGNTAGSGLGGASDSGGMGLGDTGGGFGDDAGGMAGEKGGLAMGGIVTRLMVPHGEDGFAPVQFGEGVLSKKGMKAFDDINKGKIPEAMAPDREAEPSSSFDLERSNLLPPGTSKMWDGFMYGDTVTGRPGRHSTLDSLDDADAGASLTGSTANIEQLLGELVAIARRGETFNINVTLDGRNLERIVEDVVVRRSERGLTGERVIS